MKTILQTIVQDVFARIAEFGPDEAASFTGYDLDAARRVCGAKISLYDDVPVVVKDTDGSEYWITVTRKRM